MIVILRILRENDLEILVASWMVYWNDWAYDFVSIDKLYAERPVDVRVYWRQRFNFIPFKRVSFKKLKEIEAGAFYDLKVLKKL